MALQTETAKAVEVLSLQARLDQIEASIVEAHVKLDRIYPRAGEQGVEPASDGALACANRCQEKMAELNQRLINVEELTGAL